ncbi:MAG: peptide ABC transporter substrate-binding protein [Pyrinomonadaceae bacterium]
MTKARSRCFRVWIVGCLLLSLSLSHAGCLAVRDPETYYGAVVVPNFQEFRWSDGGLPQTFDPAFAAAPPDTDVVRAIFEGLTEYDPKTLRPIPGVAARWESSVDNRTWTFYLRDDAQWSNGEKVTAGDFVRSWKRTLKIGQVAPHTELLNNIVGAVTEPQQKKAAGAEQVPAHKEGGLGAEALGDHVLRVHLQHGDANFPSLVAHSVFRPVKIDEPNATKKIDAAGLISNGPFQISRRDQYGVMLERASSYWDGQSVSLQRVTFVNSGSAEQALAAYRAGQVDAITSAPFEPLALKLLTPYKDFRRSTFGALSYYSFNLSRSPFDDVRVREALALAIDRERISRDDLGGATEPAAKFLPDEMTGEAPVVNKTESFDFDIQKAKRLLADAGFPNGAGFPTVRLLVNRNDQQRLVAQAVAAMWRTTLGIETEVVIRNWDEYEAAVKAGDFDVVRRGLVMQTTDELTNLRLLFQSEANSSGSSVDLTRQKGSIPVADNMLPVESESQALKEAKAIPIYFASSYALVKPYVSGFDANVLDAPSLKTTRIDTNWIEHSR